MCVICIVRAGQSLPSRADLWAMHQANPHGMGFASKSLSYRGMSFGTFYNRLQFVPKDENIIIHFRYATHGPVCAKNCHPFTRGGVWFAHNGILPICPKGDLTDSETAFRDVLFPVIREYGLHSDELRYTVADIIGGSRFAFIGRDGSLSLFGDFTDYKGYLCSNTNFTRYCGHRQAWSYAGCG